MQVDRRTVLKAGSALLVVPLAGFAASAHGFVFDQRFSEGRAQARLAELQGMWVQGFEADVTHVWLNHLRPHWAADRGAVAGLTSASALFCLEQMARDERYRVIQREPLEAGPDAPVRWLIGRRSAVRVSPPKGITV